MSLQPQETEQYPQFIEDDAISPIPAFVTKRLLGKPFIMKLEAISDSTRAQSKKNVQS
jgi:hypothetical protein